MLQGLHSSFPCTALYVPLGQVEHIVSTWPSQPPVLYFPAGQRLQDEHCVSLVYEHDEEMYWPVGHDVEQSVQEVALPPNEYVVIGYAELHEVQIISVLPLHPEDQYFPAAQSLHTEHSVSVFPPKKGNMFPEHFVLM